MEITDGVIQSEGGNVVVTLKKKKKKKRQHSGQCLFECAT